MAELDAQNKNLLGAPTAPVKPASSADMMRAKAALEYKMSMMNQQQAKPAPMAAAPPASKPATPPAAPPAVQPATPSDLNYPGKDLGFKPIEAPALPVSTQTQSQLQELDAQYMANQITPEEYHRQRAQILGNR